jgi:hypothetical protein
MQLMYAVDAVSEPAFEAPRWQHNGVPDQRSAGKVDNLEVN